MRQTQWDAKSDGDNPFGADDDAAAVDGADIAAIDSELEAAIAYKLAACGLHSADEILDMVVNCIRSQIRGG